MRSSAILVAMVTMISVASSQQVQIFTFTTDTGVHVRWFGNTDPSVTGWILERSDNGSPFQRLTSQPLPFITSFQQQVAMVGRYRAMFFMMLFGVNEERNLTAADIMRTYQSADVNFHLILRAAAPDIAVLAGEYYLDRSAPKQKVTYKVIPVRGEQEGTPITGSAIDASVPDVVPPPTDVEGSSADETVILRWPRNDDDARTGNVVGFKVWKGASENGPFEEATLQTSIPMFSGPDETSVFTWSDDLVENGETVHYIVRHVHVTGVYSNSSDVVTVVVGQHGQPARAMALTADRFGHAVRLHWRLSESGSVPSIVRLQRAMNGSDAFSTVFQASATDTMYTDALVELGNTYVYTITTYSDTDSSTSDTVSFALVDDVAPHAPASVRALPDTGKIHLRWTPTPDTDVAGYIILRASDSRLRNYLRLRTALLADTTFTDTMQRSAEGPFSYIVQAEDYSGNTSPATLPVIARPIDVTPPAPSQILSAIRTNSNVQITYAPSASADVASYTVERSTDTLRWTMVATSAFLTATDRPPATGRYVYRVIVRDSSGNASEPSQLYGIVIDNVLPAPAEVSVSAEEFALRIRWSAVEGAAGYRIVRIDVQNGEREVADAVSANTLQWADRYADVEKKWRYEVCARTADWQLGTPRMVEYSPRK